MQFRSISTFILLSFIVIACAVEGNGPVQDRSDEEKLIERIEAVLNSHLVEGEKWGMSFHFYRPGLEKYGPYQWLWDSAFHMISWSRLNVTNSILDLQTMLKKQVRKNGRVPQMIFWGKQSLKDKIVNKLLLSDQTITDITQMPMLPFSLIRIYEQTKNKTLLQSFIVHVAQYHEWWANYRQPDNDGLIVIIHPWQSGLDASPMYDEALGVTNPQPTLKELYPQFEQLMVSYKYIYKWKQNKIISPHKHKAKSKRLLKYFVIKEVGVNAVYAAGWKILAHLSGELNNDKMRDYCLKQYKHFSNGVISLFEGRYVSKYLDQDVYRPTRANTVQSLFPILLADVLPQHHLEFILSQLNDPKHYKSAYPIPTVSKSDPAYNPVFGIDLMWRGPSWAAPNYFILQGLRWANQTELYKQIGSKWVNEAITNGIWQMWNPQNGTGYGVKELGMSTSVIDVIYKLREM